MIRALLIDDERLALLQLEKMLKELTSIEIVATYTEPALAVQAASDLNPDVIFLDINMPEMNGLQTAEMIQDVCPAADIVFVTGYDVYALEAFELNALDYVLKPVHRNRLMKTVQRLEERTPRASEKPPQVAEVVVRCFQSLRFERGGEPLQSLRWRTTKAQEVFAYLLHHRNRFVSKDTLIDMLWTDFDLKKASTHLYTTIYQVRQCLKQADIAIDISNVSGGEGYTLNLQKVQIDTTQWEIGIRDLGPIHSGNCAEYQRLIELYSGDYFADYDYMWAESERQRLRTIWLHHAMQVAEFYTDNGKIAEAVTVYQRIVQLQPYFEEGHLGLMKVYDSIGERAAVEEQFQIIQNLLEQELGIGLPDSIEGWFEQWKLQNQRN
ncbi:response regulator [Paenibacillus eucommiae]|uniref:Two-component SAPR family response regulator n=1 Tax=Paenibacillus eucommiae TaxID=1355755 RepID=A0ABS4J843_9BACL|nr:response regulator [Paenibacillus eucommiae]MBP1996022.1 two-component SAPR family response regulator [Paenibacillus eucommiae]